MRSNGQGLQGQGQDGALACAAPARAQVTHPGAHGPVHVALAVACTAPKVPAGHTVHAAAPPRENWPGGHGPDPCALVDPAGHRCLDKHTGGRSGGGGGDHHKA